MTKKQLEQGTALKNSIDELQNKKERLEGMKRLCLENMDIAKEGTHEFYIKSINESDYDVIEISAHAAYLGVRKDVETIEKELEALNKEFAAL